MNRIQFLLSTSILGCAALAAPAFAQAPAGAGQRPQVLEEIIVTAERRAVDVQRTPTSISVRAGEVLAEEGRFNLRQILEDVPGVLYQPSMVVQGGGDTQGNLVVIRGMASNLSASGGASALSGVPATAIYVDGVYEGQGSHYDLDRVEVLRGPQGTLYGRSATGGVVAFHTRNPSFDRFEGNAAVEIGSFDLQHYTGALNIPLADTLAVRVSADLHDRGEGYFNGAGGARKKTAARVKVLFEPNDQLSVLVGASLEDNKNKFGGSTRTAHGVGVVRTTAIPISDGENHGRQIWAEINYDFGWANLTYQPAFRKWEQDDNQFVGLNRGQELVQDIVTPYSRFWTHELRLASNASDSPLSWQVGAFLFNNQLDSHNVVRFKNYGFAFQSDGQKETDAWGVFGEATYRFNEATRLTLGARYDYTMVENPSTFITNANFPCDFGFPGCTGPGTPEIVVSKSLSGAIAQEEFNNFNYKVRLEHDLTPQNLIYASVATGFLPGDVGVVEVRNGPFTSLEVNKVAAETLTAYEIGSKNRFRDNTVQLNLGLFFYDYGGFRTMFNPMPGNPGTQQTVTVPAQNIGAEVEALWQVTPNDRLALAYSYVQSRYKNKPPAFAAYITQKTQALVPQTLTVNYDHTFDLPGGSSLRAGIDVRWEASSRYMNLGLIELQRGLGPYADRDAQTIGNLKATWTSADARYQISGYVRNFTDEDQILYEQISTDGVNVSQPDPRQYGLVLSARF